MPPSLPSFKVSVLALSSMLFDGAAFNPGSHSSQHTGQEQHTPPEEAASISAKINTCSPRFAADRRPCPLVVSESNGLTTITTGELKQRISDGNTDRCATITQVPRARPRRRSPKTPIREIAATMGNTHSNPSSPTPDNASIRHHSSRNPVRILRKSSNNLLQRIESKSPLPPALSGTVIEVRQQASPPASDTRQHEHDEDHEPAHNNDPCEMTHSASAMTITDDEQKQPLSRSTTIRESRSDTRADSKRNSRVDERMGSSEDLVEVSPSRPTSQATSHPLRISPAPPLSKRDSALSPTIPAPSPLPEDSPHKYGLKDRMDTPEVTEPEEIKPVKARRRSSGLEIFNVSLHRADP